MSDLTEDYMDISPHVKILVLRPREPGLALRPNAVAERLMKFAERLTPFEGILIDLSGVDYQLSSADVASVAATIAAWVRGWVAPCAVVMTGRAADDLRKTLDITQLSTIEELQVVDTGELGLQHIVRHLERKQRAPGSR